MGSLEALIRPSIGPIFCYKKVGGWIGLWKSQHSPKTTAHRAAPTASPPPPIGDPMAIKMWPLFSYALENGATEEELTSRCSLSPFSPIVRTA